MFLIGVIAAAVFAGVVLTVGFIITAVVGAALLGGPADEDRGVDFEAAVVDDCGKYVGPDARILDDGAGLQLRGAGESSTGLRDESIVCILQALDIPETTLSRIASTRALDGRQSDQLDGLLVEWSYHPDQGLDILITQ